MYLDNIMGSYRFSYDQFICARNSDEMKPWIDRYFPYQDFPEKFPELKKNCDFREKYNSLAAHEESYNDTKANYDRTWVQTANLSLGIIIMIVGIYYQN
jgi:hypothetical protein